MLKLRSEEEVFAFLEDFLMSVFRTKIQEVDSILEALEKDIPTNFRVSGFEFLLKNFKTLEKKDLIGSGREMPQNNFSRIAKEIGPDLLFYFRGIVMNNPSTKDLAESVWNKIVAFEKRDYRLVALALILFDNFVPYRKLSFSSAEVDYISSEYTAAARDPLFKEEKRERSIRMRNLTSRFLFAPYGFKDYGLAIVWNLIKNAESDNEKFDLLKEYSKALEDFWNSASNKKVECMVEEIYA
jgi:hypothetical protein